MRDGDATRRAEPSDERVRAVTERIEREEFARGHIDPGERPFEPRPAATIVLARPSSAAGGFEVLLLERPSTARFAAGAFVFAGGIIDPEDGSEELRRRLPPALADRESPALVAALRELFEETGILLSDAAVAPASAAQARASLLRRTRTFPEVCLDLDLAFRKLRAIYLSRWVTPARFRKRYDTRFFVAEQAGAATGQQPELTDELAGKQWLTASEAVSRFAEDRLPMLFPTRRTLLTLAEYATLEGLFEERGGRDVEPVEPRLFVDGDAVRPVLPDDPDYENAW